MNQRRNFKGNLTIFELNEKEITASGALEAVHRGTFIALNAYFRKGSKIKNQYPKFLP